MEYFHSTGHLYILFVNDLFVSFSIFLYCSNCLIYWIVRTLYILRALLKCLFVQDVFSDLPRESSFLKECILYTFLFFSISPLNLLYIYLFVNIYISICLLFVCLKIYKFNGGQDLFCSHLYPQHVEYLAQSKYPVNTCRINKYRFFVHYVNLKYFPSLWFCFVLFFSLWYFWTYRHFKILHSHSCWSFSLCSFLFLLCFWSFSSVSRLDEYLHFF